MASPDTMLNLSPEFFDHVVARGILHGREACCVTDDLVDEPGPRILFVNSAFTELTGYRADEILGRSPRVLQGPLSDRSTLDRLRECMIDRQRFDGETVNYRKDGRPFVMSWRVVPVDSPDTRQFFVALQSDVTDDRRNERFATSRAYLGSAMRSVLAADSPRPDLMVGALLTALVSAINVYVQGGEASASVGSISAGPAGADIDASNDMTVEYGPAGTTVRLPIAGESSHRLGTVIVEGIADGLLELISLEHVQQLVETAAGPIDTVIRTHGIPD